MLFAYVFGTSGQYDAYIVAISIPFLLRNIFAEGGLSSAFIPLYKKNSNKNSFATHVFMFILVTAGIASLLLMLFSKTMVTVFAGGLKPSSFNLAVRGERITAFFLLFISLWSWGAGVLNSHGKFFVPSLSPMFNNLFVIVALLVAFFFHKGITIVCIGFLMGGLSQFIFEIPFLKRTGFRFEFSDHQDDIKRFLRTFAFTSLAVSLGQVNLFVDTNVASRLVTGSISTIQYANRLYQLPLGILVISLATVYLPEMSSHANIDDLKNSIHDAFSKLLFISIPSTLFIILFSHPIVNLLYVHGTFSLKSAVLTSQVLTILMIGFPFRSAVIVMNRALYAFENAKIATLITSVGVTVNAVGDLTLGFMYSVNGLAISTVLSSVTSTIIVYLIERKKYGIRFFDLKEETFKIFSAVFLSSLLILPILHIQNVFLSCTLGFIMFFLSFWVFSLLFKSENASNILNVLNRKRKKQ